MKFNPDMSFPFVQCIVVMISLKLLCGTKVQIKCFTCKAKASQDIRGLDFLNLDLIRKSI